MAVEFHSFHHTSLPKKIDFRTSKIHNVPIQRGHELPKDLRKSTESKKKCSFIQSLQNHGGEELLKILIRERIEKVNMKETKSKPKTESKKVCICSPTNHEGSFKCRYHRKSEANKSRTDKKLISLCFSSKNMHDLVDSRSNLSRFGKGVSAEVDQHNLRQLSTLVAA